MKEDHELRKVMGKINMVWLLFVMLAPILFIEGRGGTILNNFIYCMVYLPGSFGIVKLSEYIDAKYDKTPTIQKRT